MRKSRELVKQAQRLTAADLRQCLVRAHPSEEIDRPLELVHAAQLTDEQRTQIVELFESNMKHLYEQSHGGYDPQDKRRELFDDQARYLLVHSSERLLAFAHFRFDMDYGSRVVYLYELQVDKQCQGQGLGQWMMEQLKCICRETQMAKIVLTVHKANGKAIDFYRGRCQFDADSTDPSDEDVDYVILSFSV